MALLVLEWGKGGREGNRWGMWGGSAAGELEC